MDRDEGARAWTVPAVKEAVDYAKTLGAAFLVMLVVRILVFQPYTIPSSSMEPGVQTGDYIVASKWSYGWSRASIPFNPPLFRGRIGGRAPARDDVVLFRLPRDTRQVYIKRLIGLPGDRVQVLRGVVVVNGRPIPRQLAGLAADHDAPGRIVPRIVETAPDGRRYLTFGGAPDHDGDNTDVYVVPAGTYFFMGDNRDNSLDSRFPKENDGVGFVPAENLEGKAQIILLSWNKGASLFKPWTWVMDARPSRFFHYLY